MPARKAHSTYQYTRRLINHQRLPALALPVYFQRGRCECRWVPVAARRRFVVLEREHRLDAVLGRVADVCVRCVCRFEDEPDEFASTWDRGPVDELVGRGCAGFLGRGHCEGYGGVLCIELGGIVCNWIRQCD